MATRTCVAKTMAVLGATFPRDITPELVAIYAQALDDLTDADLELALNRAVSTCRFFPVPAELRDFVGANAPARIELEPILERIRGLFTYTPTSGDQPPRVDEVRRELGDAIAQAYGTLGGGERLFASNETTRAIARREFADELRAIARTNPAALQIPAPNMRALPAVEIYSEPPQQQTSTFRRLLPS